MCELISTEQDATTSNFFQHPRLHKEWLLVKTPLLNGVTFYKVHVMTCLGLKKHTV